MARSSISSAELDGLLDERAPESGACTCGERALPVVLTAQDPPSSPWVLRRDHWPNVKIYIRNLGPRWGQTIWREGMPEIHLAHNLGPVSRRCTLAHELVHVALGPPCRRLCPEDEEAVQEATARWLLPNLAVVAEHLARFDVDEAASRLHVMRSVLMKRLDGMTSRELERLGAALGSVAEPLDA